MIAFASFLYFAMLRARFRAICLRASGPAKRLTGLSWREQLQARQAVTRLRGELLPPLLSGTRWSSVMSVGAAPCRSLRFNSRAREGRDGRNYSILRDKALGGCFREPWLLSNIMQLSKSRVLRLPVAMQNIAAICIF